MPAYCATRSIFAAPKWYKEYVRPDMVSDFDRRASFPSVILARYPDLDIIREWINDKSKCVEACGLPANEENLKALKEFCNAAGGSGQPVMDQFLAATGLTEAPAFCLRYREAVRYAKERDCQKEEHLVEILRKEGYSNNDIGNKVHYICNERTEREELDAALDAVGNDADVVSLESDGCPCMPKGEGTDEWRARVLALMDGAVTSTTHTWKPYRSPTDILETMKSKFPNVPEEAWTQVDSDWEKIETLKAECRKRLRNEEKPVMWLKDLVPWHALPCGRLVKDVYRCIAASKDTMEWWKFAYLPRGGMWKHIPPPVAKSELEGIVLEMLCRIYGTSMLNAQRIP